MLKGRGRGSGWGSEVARERGNEVRKEMNWLGCRRCMALRIWALTSSDMSLWIFATYSAFGVSSAHIPRSP